MKKSLLALAAMGAFAGAAQAQSSVTVYGIIDMGFQSSSTRGNSANANKLTNAGFFAGGNGAETSSRLGFRGVEDLGGGMRAFFTIETELAGQTTDAINGNRQTFLGLGKKGLGQASIGTQYTVVHDAVSSTDPGQSNNVIGSVIRPSGGSVSGNNSSGGNHMVRTTNMLKLSTDRFAGLRVAGQYIQNNQNTTQSLTGTSTTAGSGGTSNFFGWGLSADYVWQKLQVVGAYQVITNEQNGSAGTTAPTFPATITNAVNPNTKTNDMYVAGVYDFGILKAYVGYTNRKIESTYDSNQYLKRTGQQIGVRGYITKAVEGWASVGNGKWTSYGVGSPSANFNSWQLGSNYWLSKRTNLYAIYGQTVTGIATNIPNGAAGSQYALGVRHTF